MKLEAGIDWPVTEGAFLGYRGSEETVTLTEIETMAGIQGGRREWMGPNTQWGGSGCWQGTAF